jgi:NitT/TauT family transport system substrate-binding protein
LSYGSESRLVSRRGALRAGAAAVTALAMPSIARAQVKEIPFSLDFRIYGGNCPFFLGEESGINKELGFSFKLDGAPGSGEAIRRIASGTHTFAFADIATLIEFSARNPEQAPKVLLSIFDDFPACVISFGKKPIETLKDMEGARIGIGAASAATKIMPALLELNDIDSKKVTFTTVDVKLRDSLLLRGAIDGVIGFDYTSVFNMLEAGAKLGDLHFLYFSKFGFNFPSNSLVASRSVIESDPDLCKRVTLAVARAWKAACKDPKAAATVVHNREPLLQTSVEQARFEWVRDKHILTDNVRAHGLGALDPARMEKGNLLLQKGFEIPETPKLTDYFDGRFMPDASELKLV